ncbi:hypothetical protein [Conexibacter sp. SYSU D00693]|uniref:hypothetical protein n=1 Tax=Conexibacter sp. SYSU D00693 TaxID=2812560 RepID=UPI00196B4AF7|nr:hypothetical protein [Conexibacter sp. SYSU D00693]
MSVQDGGGPGIDDGEVAPHGEPSVGTMIAGVAALVVVVVLVFFALGYLIGRLVL